MKKTKQTIGKKTQESSIVHPSALYSTPEEIEQRAHQIYLARGGNCHPLIGWLQADNELRAEMSRRQSDTPPVLEKLSYFQS